MFHLLNSYVALYTILILLFDNLLIEQLKDLC